ncbi:MAG: aldose 1-epimerase family protein [Chthoniobacteraceae bacterium]
MSVSLQSAEPFRRSIASVVKNLRTEQVEFSGENETPGSPPWTITKSTLHGGKQEGVDVIAVKNGKLQFTVVPTRGMSVLRVQCGDLRLGWDSPVKEVVNPSLIDLQSRGGLGWLEGFNEWMVRCGLESNGHPGTDKFVNNVGDEATMDLTLHGKIGNIPASEVEVVVDREPPYRIRIRGRVDERMFYGPKLELWTEISTVPGSNELRISDTVTNRGEYEQEFELLYHTNFGRPLLEEGAQFLAPIARITPFNEHAAKSIAQHATYTAPTPGFIEQVYCIRPLADAGGRTEILLQNKACNRGVSMAWSVKELPYLTQWKNTPPELEGYVTGIEPGTNFPANRRVERKYGRVPKLKAGESHTATIDFAIHLDGGSVKNAAGRIAKLQGDTKPVIDARPEPKD